MKNEQGSALILITVVMLTVFMTAAVSLNVTNYETLATEASVKNINGYPLAEGGVINAERLLNKILAARFRSVAEEAVSRITVAEPGGAADGEPVAATGETGTLSDEHRGTETLFLEIFGGLMDAEAAGIINSALFYEISFNDNYETEYAVTVGINHSGGGFDVRSTAVNIKTGVADAAIGRIELTYAPEPADPFVIRAECFKYEIKGVKKAFE